MTIEMNLMKGDCLERMKEIEDGSVDLILTDPPYQITKCKWDTAIPFEPMWEQLKRIIKISGVIALFGSEPFSSKLRNSNAKNYKYDWYWSKNKCTNFLNANKQPLRQIENICVFYEKQCNYNPQKTTGHRPTNKYTKHTSDGETLGKTKQGGSYGGQTDRFPTNLIKDISVVNNDNSKKNKYHPTQKPAKLMEYLIKTYTNESETILDFCSGSGTTGIACANLNRNFIGVENDSGYFDIGLNRIKDHVRNMDLDVEINVS